MVYYGGYAFTGVILFSVNLRKYDFFVFCVMLKLLCISGKLSDKFRTPHV